MTDKEFQKLNRAELIEIIYKLRQNEEQLKDENSNLRRKLASKELKLSNAGSIAEAALALNDVFEAAQKAADDYLELIHLSNDEIAEKVDSVIMQANERAAGIVSNAEKQAAEIINLAESESRKRWEEVNSNIDTILKNHSSLIESVKNEDKAENE